MISNKAKIISGVSGAVGLIVVCYQLTTYIYDSGWDAALNHVTAEYNKKIEANKAEYELKIKKALDIMAEDHSQEIKRIESQREIKVKTEKVVEYVKQYIEVPAECTDLADNVGRVLDQATDIIIGAYESSRNTNTERPVD